MKIYKTDTPVTVAAKKAAMICQYSIHNPLHVFFEDHNYHSNPMDFERKCNERYREKNGDRMYQFIKEFLDEFDALSKEERREAYRLYRKKSDYLANKWRKKIAENSKPQEPGSILGIAYRHYLGADGHIYVKTFLGVELMQF